MYCDTLSHWVTAHEYECYSLSVRPDLYSFSSLAYTCSKDCLSIGLKNEMAARARVVHYGSRWGKNNWSSKRHAYLANIFDLLSCSSAPLPSGAFGKQRPPLILYSLLNTLLFTLPWTLLAQRLHAMLSLSCNFSRLQLT